MKLKDIIKIEEELLKIDDNNGVFNHDINVVVLTTNYIKIIGDITNIYFGMLEQYASQIETQNCDYQTKLKIVEDYNQKLLNTDINIELISNNFISEEKLNNLLITLNQN